jgi:hypothetical protein
MTQFSTALGRVRRWLRVGEHGGSRGRNAVRHLTLEVGGTVRITPAGNGQVEASIVGRIHAPACDEALHGARDDAPHGPGAERREEITVEARCRSIAAVAASDPYATLQLLDDDGVALTYEVPLGHGVGTRYDFHARIDMRTRAEPLRDTPPRLFADTLSVDAPHALVSGLRARVVTTTYRNDRGPQYHVEALTLTLLDAGAEFPGPPRPTVLQPALLLSLPRAVPRPRPMDVPVPS